MADVGRPAPAATFVSLVTRVVELEETATAAAPLREALQSLLSRFPLCFGYWKRLAELELAYESEPAAVAVYERAVVPLAFSVDMWSLYVGHAVRHWPAQPDRVRALFERAAPLIGSDYLADSFWDQYLAYEEAAAAADPSADASRVGALYVRVLALPLRAADAYWLRFQRFAAGCGSSAEVLDREREAQVRAELAADGAPDTGAEREDDGARKMRVLALMDARFHRHRAAHAQQLGLESAVRRRFFHIRPVDPADLAAWGRILAWHRNSPLHPNSPAGAAHSSCPGHANSPAGAPPAAEGAAEVQAAEGRADGGGWPSGGGEGGGQGVGEGGGGRGGPSSVAWAAGASADSRTVERCCVAYERALLPCAGERSVWLEYAAFLEEAGWVAAARGVLRRATGQFFSACVPTILAHAAFEEEHGDLAEARRLSSAAASLSPPSLEAVLASANLERRAGNFSAAAAALSSGAQRLSGDALAVLARHVAAAEWRAGRPEAGRAVLRAAVDRQPHSEMTWEAALAFEIEMDQARQAGRAARQMEIDADGEAGAAAENGGTAHSVAALVEALFERMLARETPLPPAAKRRAWLRYQQYSDDHAGSVALPRRLKRDRDAMSGAIPFEPTLSAVAPLAPQAPPAACSLHSGALVAGGAPPAANGHGGGAEAPPLPLANGGADGVQAASLQPQLALLPPLTPEQAAQQQMAEQHAASHAQWQHYQQYYAHQMAQQSYAQGYGYYRTA